MTERIGSGERVPPPRQPSHQEEEELAKITKEKMTALPPIKEPNFSTPDALTKSLEQSSGTLDKLELTTEVDSQKSPSLSAWAKTHSESLLPAAYEKAKAGEHFGGVQKIFLIPETVLDPLYTYYARPLKKHLIPLAGVNEVLRDIANGIIDARLVFKIPETLGTGASLIYRRIVLKALTKQLDVEAQQLKLSRDDAKSKMLKEVRVWLKIQNERLFQEEKAFGISTFAYLPHGIEVVGTLAGGLVKPLELANLGIFGAAKITTESYTLHKTLKQKATYEEWVQGFNDAIRMQTLTFPEPVAKSNDKKKATHPIDTLLKKRKDVLTKRVEKMVNRDIPYETIPEDLLKKLQIANRKEYVNFVSKPKNKRKLLRLYLEKKQAMSVMTRNALKTLAEKKLKNQKKFFDFKIKRSAFSLTLSTLFFSTMFTLKALALASVIALSAAVFAYAGLGFFVAGIAIICVGLCFLRYYRPNLFREVIRGVQLRIALHTIPLSYYQFRLTLLRTKKLRNELKLSTINTKGDEAQRKKEEEKMQPELAKLDKKISALEAKAAKWEKRIKPLKQRLINAGWRDFQRTLNLTKHPEKPDLATVLAEGMFYDDAFLDIPTKKLLQEQLGIDLQALRKRHQDNKNEAINEAQEALKTFFSMDEDALIDFIKQQKAAFDFGMIGGSAG